MMGSGREALNLGTLWDHGHPSHHHSELGKQSSNGIELSPPSAHRKLRSCKRLGLGSPTPHWQLG